MAIEAAGGVALGTDPLEGWLAAVNSGSAARAAAEGSNGGVVPAADRVGNGIVGGDVTSGVAAAPKREQ